MRTYFAISDIHGADISLVDFAFEGFDITNPDHFIVLMGDYWDRRKGNSYQILQFIEYLYRELPDRSVVIIGNHDEMFLNILKQLDKVDINDSIHISHLDLQLYYSNGGAPTLRELIGGVTPAAMMTAAKKRRVRRTIQAIERMKPYMETDKYIFTHAYINADREVDTWDRNMIYSQGIDDKYIIVGHTSFFHLGGEATVHDWKWAESSRLDNKVIIIDNGHGTNIVRFDE